MRNRDDIEFYGYGAAGRALPEAGADGSLRNTQGPTALGEILGSKYTEMIALLESEPPSLLSDLESPPQF